jgi:hypothetical protein
MIVLRVFDMLCLGAKNNSAVIDSKLQDFRLQGKRFWSKLEFFRFRKLEVWVPFSF